jgi:hypothetical protein
MTKMRIRGQIKFFNSSINSTKTPKHLKMALRRKVKVLEKLVRSR